MIRGTEIIFFSEILVSFNIICGTLEMRKIILKSHCNHVYTRHIRKTGIAYAFRDMGKRNTYPLLVGMLSYPIPMRNVMKVSRKSKNKTTSGFLPPEHKNIYLKDISTFPFISVLSIIARNGTNQSANNRRMENGSRIDLHHGILYRCKK